MIEEQLKSPPLGEVVTEEEWSSWKEHPTTKTFRALLRKRLGERMEDWLTGQFITPERNAKAIGECQVLKAILELSVEDINTGMSDE